MSPTERDEVLAAGSELSTVTWRTTVVPPFEERPAYVAAPAAPTAAAAARAAAEVNVRRLVMTCPFVRPCGASMGAATPKTHLRPA
jgi:hypothetical protein